MTKHLVVLAFVVPIAGGMISCGGKKTNAIIDPATGKTVEAIDSAAIKYPEGEAVYNKSCIACHQSDGEGVAGAFPPLASSDYMLADKNRAIYQVIHGSSGAVVVNGTTYNGIMPPQELTAEEVKNVMNYVLNAWGNKGGEVTAEQVEAQKVP
jgi:mono/diheme cytochrome c family protein